MKVLNPSLSADLATKENRMQSTSDIVGRPQMIQRFLKLIVRSFFFFFGGGGGGGHSSCLVVATECSEESEVELWGLNLYRLVVHSMIHNRASPLC